MKKTFLTFIAVGFGFSVAFAQTAPTQGNPEAKQAPTEQAIANQDKQDKRQVEMSELPQETQDAFKNGEYSDLKVLAIYEKTGNAEDAAAMTSEPKTIYEFELARTGGTADAGATDEGLAGVETERVSARQPDVILQIDDKGQVIKEKDLDKKQKDKKEKQ